MKEITAYHLTPKKNIDSIMEKGLIPQQNNGDEYGIYLFPDMETMENALWNWFGERFDDLPDIELCLLHVDITNIDYTTPVPYEMRIDKVISPNRIKKVEYGF